MRFDKPGHGSGAMELRRGLFGNLPLDEWPPDSIADAYPWASFVQAREAWRLGDRVAAVSSWSAIAHGTDIESRHILQAWHYLRLSGVQPTPGEAVQVLGLTAEVAVGEGHDLLAAYADRTVRYLNHAGGAVVVDDASIEDLASAVDSWLEVGRRLAPMVGTWNSDTLPPLPSGHTRIVMLTPAGLRFGQGPDAQLRSSAAAATFLHAATQLLLAVTRCVE